MPIFRYLALGDSYTIGESVSVEDRWPNQLANLLEAEGIQTEVTIIARTGWTVDELWQGIQVNPPGGIYDLVTLLIGVNNQYRGYPANGYQEDFRFMLGKAIEYAGGNPGHVVVLSIAINLEESKFAGAHYVDVTAISRNATNDSTLIAPDGLHPSGKMYTMWAEAALPIVRGILISSKKEKL